MMKYGRRISISPCEASSRASIAAISVRIDAADSGSRWPASTSMKRDMCVPFACDGSATNMSTEATDGWLPPAVATCTGCVSERTPTRAMATLRRSWLACTSGRNIGSGAFIGES